MNHTGFAGLTGVENSIRRACDWQLAHLPTRYWSANRLRWSEVEDNGWIRSTFFTGVMAAYRATGDPKYLDTARTWGRRNGWRPGPRLRHADDHCCGQTYVELYLLEKDPAMIGPLREVLDQVAADRMPGPVVGWDNDKNWAWCDALFMAPPTMARLAAATGERKYLKAMNAMWWESHEYLYDEEEGLYYRDARFKPDATPLLRSKRGKPIFWSRGNGWVLAGLARVLAFMPEDFLERPRYVSLFQKLAARLAALQPADGLWRSNLLDPADAPDPEASGSGFFCYGLAWGINHGLLACEEYLPAVTKAWQALCGCLDEDGMLHRVQGVGHQPGAVAWGETCEYGTGAFLLAGGEVASLASR